MKQEFALSDHSSDEDDDALTGIIDFPFP